MAQKIFWLEDNPDFAINCLPNEFKTPQKLADLAQKTIFSYDYKEAKGIVFAKSFDLYILDADFPDVIKPRRRSRNDLYLDALKKGKDIYITPLLLDDQVYDNFVGFYTECLSPVMDVVVFSSSEPAAERAFSLKLPFYSKRHSRDDIESFIKKSKTIDPDQRNLADWEFGDAEDFARKYLT